MYFILIKPLILYCSVTWTSCYSHDNTSNVFKLQKRCAPIILNAQQRHITVDLFNTLKWVPYKIESDIKRCLMAHKTIIGICPARGRRGGLMVSALDSGASGPGSSPGREHWTRHFTLTVPLSTQVYKWVPANCWGNLTNCGEGTCDGLASRPGKVEILLAASCYRSRDKLRQL